MKRFDVQKVDGMSTVTEEPKRKGGLKAEWESLGKSGRLFVAYFGLLFASVWIYCFVMLFIYFGGR